MIYVALLRGINVGGKNKVVMSKLKATFEDAGMKDVTTYINSGNVVFKDNRRKPATIAAAVEKAIERDFGFRIEVLLRDLPSIKRLLNSLPKQWTNDADMRCDVLFLWDRFDRKGIMQELTIKPDIEDVKYVPGALFWRVDRSNARKSSLPRIIGTDLYKGMTIRNANTVRKLGELMQAADARSRAKPAGGVGS